TSPAGDLLAIASSDGLEVLRAADRSTVYALGPDVIGYPTALRFAPDGRRLVMLDGRSVAVVLGPGGEFVAFADVTPARATAAWLSADDERILVTGDDGQLRVFDAGDGKLLLATAVSATIYDGA